MTQDNHDPYFYKRKGDTKKIGIETGRKEMFDILSVNCFYYNYDMPDDHICDMEHTKPTDCSMTSCTLLKEK